jgi:hypothetical protein
MLRPITHRVTHIVALWQEGLWGKLFGAVWFVLGVLIVFRDEIWMPKDDKEYKVINMILHISIELWMIIFLVIMLAWIFEASFRIIKRLNETVSSLRSHETPLEIIFNPANPNKKFWSIEPMKDENGKQIAGSFWEYRAVIKNKSARTVRNVKVIVEAIGVMPTRPEHSHFDINQKPLIDLTPDEETLAVIRCWHNPPIVAGMAIGEGIYGPIKMTASADDVLPSTKFFQFDPMKTPMIYELDTGT